MKQNKTANTHRNSLYIGITEFLLLAIEFPCAVFIFSKYKCVYSHSSEPGSSVSMVSGYGLDNREIEVQSPVEAKGFFL
jgi:hypothetical protein